MLMHPLRASTNLQTIVHFAIAYDFLYFTQLAFPGCHRLYLAIDIPMRKSAIFYGDVKGVGLCRLVKASE
jgi:hypothetical protein